MTRISFNGGPFAGETRYVPEIVARVEFPREGCYMQTHRFDLGNSEVFDWWPYNASTDRYERLAPLPSDGDAHLHFELKTADPAKALGSFWHDQIEHYQAIASDLVQYRDFFPRHVNAPCTIQPITEQENTMNPTTAQLKAELEKAESELTRESDRCSKRRAKFYDSQTLVRDATNRRDKLAADLATAYRRERYQLPTLDGSIIEFAKQFSRGGTTYDYVARLVKGRWYTTGRDCPPRGFSNGELVEFIEKDNASGLRRVTTVRRGPRSGGLFADAEAAAYSWDV